MKRPTRLALLAGLTVFLTAAGATTGYALWSTSASTSTQVRAAEVALISDKTAASTLAGPYGPGDSMTEAITLTNGGTVDLDVTATATTTFVQGGLSGDAVSLSVWRVEQGACTDPDVPAGAWTGTLNALDTAPAWTIAAAATQSLCLRATLIGDIESTDQGDVASARITFTGTNGWTSTATVGIEPVVRTVPAPGSAATPCASTRDGSNKYLLLSWTGSAAGYRVTYDPPSTSAPDPDSPVTGNSVEVRGTYFDFNGTGAAVTVTVQAIDENGWLSAPLSYSLSPGSNAKSNEKIYCSSPQ